MSRSQIYSNICRLPPTYVAKLVFFYLISLYWSLALCVTRQYTGNRRAEVRDSFKRAKWRDFQTLYINCIFPNFILIWTSSYCTISFKKIKINKNNFRYQWNVIVGTYQSMLLRLLLELYITYISILYSYFIIQMYALLFCFHILKRERQWEACDGLW